MLRKFAVLALFSLAVAGWAAASHPDVNGTIHIMTQNMDDGTDQTYIIAALSPSPPLSVREAVDLTFAELQASSFELRAKLLAAAIAEGKPEIVALQEAALWRFGHTTHTADHVLYDSLDLLLSALKKLKVPYDVVAVDSLSDFALQGDTIRGALRFTDRNAVLVRSDLRPHELRLSNVHSRTFDAALRFAGLRITAGWISADVHMGDKHFRFVTTHLQKPIQVIPEAADVQEAQARELIDELSHTSRPVVICGDFNSDALLGAFGAILDKTATVDIIEAAGYVETWPLPQINGGDPGFTWPLYLEDQSNPPPFFAFSTPFERIDLFFSKDMEAVSARHATSDPTAPGDPTFFIPPRGSDHSGVIAVYSFLP